MEPDVKHIAKLAMLHFSEEEQETFSREFSALVHMVEHLPELESSATLLEPDNLMELREDTETPSYPREVLLQNVPQQAAGCIAVPRTVE